MQKRLPGWTRLIDLHCHSDCSDGTLTPAALVDLAVSTGLQAVAITDHDTFDGYDQATAYAAERGLELLCAVEVGTRLAGMHRSAHVLGYFQTEPGDAMRRWLGALQTSRQERNLALHEQLQQQGVCIPWEQLRSRGKRQLGRPHFAQAMLELGYVHSLQEAFDRYLAETGSAWTKRDEPSTEEAIRQVVHAGGVASLAHPVRLTRSMDMLGQIIPRLASGGLTALECYHPEHTSEETRWFLSMAASYGLAVTGGSDFHGANKPGIRLGFGNGNLQVPDAFLSELKLRFSRAS